MTGGVVECCQQISTVDYVDNSKRRFRLYQSIGRLRRREQNKIYLYALVNLKRDY